MAFDIKKTVEDIIEKIKDDPAMLKKFKTQPTKVVEELIGIDLPDDAIEKVVDLVKAKLDLDKVGDIIGGIGSLFGK